MQTPIIDAHLHLIYRDRLRYPWLAGVAPLNRDFPYETYAVEARRCGVSDAIHMEVDVTPDDIEAETRNVEDLTRRPEVSCVARSARVGRRMTPSPLSSMAS